ncbi:hypothetical protein SAMN05192555_1189 [Franzmannia pantelleriensis]|uniref:UPF0250 protein SAMN05192555_1189 n=1 Tax=Franzmannia pantelleriensis TaxID=48727 RepID=A0A1G9VHN6_9GAMM|nr:DUF493 domain-containing protein [Halomonas pantelleriensis]SDM71626.1 hypothetical protein SAMN05192555_1189 [Halomonas pantelleriensis]
MADKPLRDLRLDTPATSAPAPRVEFPCDYSLKIVGDAADDFHDTVVEVVETHAPGFDRKSVRVVDSRNGKFQSVRLTIIATGKPQLEALFAELKATGRVHMVL